MRHYLFLTSILLSLNVNAQIYKCKNNEGRIIYQQVQCYGSSSVNIIKNNNSVTIEDQMSARNRHLDIQEQNRKATEGRALEVQRREKASIEYKEAERLRQEDERARQIEQRKLNALEDIARNSNRTLHCRPDYAGGAYCK
jgi:DNA polymerase III alpha subunit (gram-positive type)